MNILQRKNYIKKGGIRVFALIIVFGLIWCESPAKLLDLQEMFLVFFLDSFGLETAAQKFLFSRGPPGKGWYASLLF